MQPYARPISQNPQSSPDSQEKGRMRGPIGEQSPEGSAVAGTVLHAGPVARAPRLIGVDVAIAIPVEPGEACPGRGEVFILRNDAVAVRVHVPDEALGATGCALLRLRRRFDLRGGDLAVAGRVEPSEFRRRGGQELILADHAVVVRVEPVEMLLREIGATTIGMRRLAGVWSVR